MLDSHTQHQALILSIPQTDFHFNENPCSYTENLLSSDKKNFYPVGRQAKRSALKKGEANMVSIIRFLPTFTVMVLTVLILGCDGDGGSGAAEPLADEPMILESVMCLDVDDTRPVGITNSFFESDEKIYIWIYWSNVEDESIVEAFWYEPDGESPFREDLQEINSSTGFGITWFFIERPIDGFTDGEWSVDIYMDGLFERSHLFVVE